MTSIKGYCEEKTTMEKIKQIRVRLEILAEEDKEYNQRLIDEIRDNGTFEKGRKINIASRHSNYIAGINVAYETMCRDFDVPYKPIKSGLSVK